MDEDISREGLTGEKVRQLGRLFRPDCNRAIAKVSRFSVIDISRINDLLGTNFKGVILDIDECVAPHHGEVSRENVDSIIRMINQGVKIVVFSNMKAGERYNPLIEAVRQTAGYQIKVITSRYAKPDPRGFRECVDALELAENEKALMIGDNFVTDGGAVMAGIPFVKVKPMRTPGESAWGKIKRSAQIVSRFFYTWISDLYDFLGKRMVLKDKDFMDNDRNSD